MTVHNSINSALNPQSEALVTFIGKVTNSGFRAVRELVDTTAELDHAVDLLLNALTSKSVNDGVKVNVIKGLDDLRFSDIENHKKAYGVVTIKLAEAEPATVGGVLDLALQAGSDSFAVHVVVEANEQQQSEIIRRMTRRDPFAKAIGNTKALPDHDRFLQVLTALLEDDFHTTENHPAVVRFSKILENPTINTDTCSELISTILNSKGGLVFLNNVAKHLDSQRSQSTAHTVRKAIIEKLSPERTWTRELEDWLRLVINSQSEQFIRYFAAVAAASDDLAIRTLEKFQDKIPATSVPAVLRLLAQDRNQEQERKQNLVKNALEKLGRNITTYIESYGSSRGYGLLNQIYSSLAEHLGSEASHEIITETLGYKPSCLSWKKVR